MDDGSSPDEPFLPSNLINMTTVTSMPTSMPAPSTMVAQADMAPMSSHMVQPQMLRQHM